jgi:hypothetical protein
VEPKTKGTTQTLGLAHPPPRFLTIRSQFLDFSPLDPLLSPFSAVRCPPPARWREIGQTRMHDSHGAGWQGHGRQTPCSTSRGIDMGHPDQ